jgi:diguanylate cyclase (GGDEF)-like protein
MQADLLNLLYKKNNLSCIIFNENFEIIETQNVNFEFQKDIRDLLWELVGLEETILALLSNNETISIPMIFREDDYYDLEIETFPVNSEKTHFVATLQKKSQQTQEYANVIKEINKKTLIYETSDTKKENDTYKFINKRLLTLHIDLNGIITLVNDACTHFFNIEKEAMCNKHFSEFFYTHKSQLNSSSNIFIAKNFNDEDIFFHTEIIPITDKSGKVVENLIIAQDISHLKRIKKELQYAQEHDTLTGLANRHTFLKEIDELIEKEEFFCITFLDIDNFHSVNDDYGSHAGDMLLKHLTTLLIEFIEDEDKLMRIQADTFAIIFETQKNQTYIQAMTETLKKLASSNPLYYNSEDIIEFDFTTLNICYPKDFTNSKELLKIADKNIKREKIKKLV